MCCGSVSGSSYLDLFHYLIVVSVDCELSSVWNGEKEEKGVFARNVPGRNMEKIAKIDLLLNDVGDGVLCHVTALLACSILKGAALCTYIVGT